MMGIGKLRTLPGGTIYLFRLFIIGGLWEIGTGGWKARNSFPGIFGWRRILKRASDLQFFPIFPKRLLA